MTDEPIKTGYMQVVGTPIPFSKENPCLCGAIVPHVINDFCVEPNVLFLDVDGVMNSAETARKAQKRGGIIGIDPYLTLLVHRIIEATKCRVVLSSTWRLFDADRKTVYDAVPYIDVTPSIRTAGRVRGDEIKAWLDSKPRVKKYAILDDDSDMLPEQLPNFFQTTWEKGLTEEIVAKVIKHFNE